MPFTGRATYDEINEMQKDVSQVIGMISPFETTLLDHLGDAQFPTKASVHHWLEEDLVPGTVTNSTAIASATADTAVQVNGTGAYLQVGDIVRYLGGGAIANEELMQVTVVTGDNSVTFSRGFGSIGPSSLAAGGSIELVSNAGLEGADAGNDISKARTQQFNFTQILQKPIQVSGTKEAVSQYGGVTSEMDHQALNRFKEIARDLERAAILMELSGSSLGSSTGYRTMKGIWRFISTNDNSAATVTESFLNNVVAKGAWDAGAKDCDTLVADGSWKQLIDNFAESRYQQPPADRSFVKQVNRYEATYFNLAILPPNRWMPATSLMILASGRINVTNLQTRSFKREPLAKTGDSTKEQIVGEYTVELHNENGMARAHNG